MIGRSVNTAFSLVDILLYIFSLQKLQKLHKINTRYQKQKGIGDTFEHVADLSILVNIFVIL